MTKKKTQRSVPPASFDQARDELFSHILRCGVMEAELEHQKEWFDDTMQYLTERYPDLAEVDRTNLRLLGERYCRPVVQRQAEAVGSGSAE